MSAFDLVQDLQIGRVVEVTGTAMKVELLGSVAELTRVYEGRVYPIGQIGSMVKVHFGRCIIFGFVTMLRMFTEEQTGSQTQKPLEPDQRLMEVDLFAEGVWSSATKQLALNRGVSTYPLPNQGVFLLTKEEGEAIYTAAESLASRDELDPLVPFAVYTGSSGVTCRANMDKLFGMHCAVVGSTGSGKSGAVAALLHGMLEHQVALGRPSHPRVIVLDPHNEYGLAFGSRALTYRAYDPLGAGSSPGTIIRLPYWLMSADEFRKLVIGKTEHEATAQHNIVYKALAHARMVEAGLVEQAPTRYGASIPGEEEPDYPRPRAGVDEAQLIQFDVDRPRPFSLEEFYRHIVYLQGARIVRGTRVTERIPSSEFAKTFGSVLDKLAVLRRDTRVAFLMREWHSGDPSLGDIIAQLVGESTAADGSAQDIRVIDLSGLPNEVAGPLTAMLARLLFQYKLYQNDEERTRDPLVIVCEEAHRYVPDRGEAEYADAQRSIRRIAREGRKHGLGLMLVSQRPADVDSTVISQCGTWVVLRLSNATDQQYVARFLPDGLSGMARALSNLSQQEALFVGAGAAIPARIRIRDLQEHQRPRSSTARFAHAWTVPRLSREQIACIATRMADDIPAADPENP